MKGSFKINIKEGKALDIKNFYKLFKGSVKKSFPEYSFKAKQSFFKKDYTEKQFLKWLAIKEIDLLLAFFNKEIVGYLVGGFSIGGISFISWLVVKSKFQRKGIGSALLKRYEGIVKGKGLHKIHLWTNKRSTQFYKKNGYILVGHISKNFFGADDWLFYKKIQSPKY